MMNILDASLKASFSKKYLNESPSPKQFLKNIQYNVEVQNLLRISKTCQYSESADFCPVIIEVIDDHVRKTLGERFILQVYNRQGKVVYQRYLKFELVSWSIFAKTFIFKLDRREGEPNCLHVVWLDKKAAVMKIKDFAPDDTYIHLGFSQDCLFYANHKNIKVADLKVQPVKDGETVSVEMAETRILNWDIPAPNKLHGFFENSFSVNDEYIMCMIETEDNQMDFNRLYFFNRDFAAPNFSHYQYREVVLREVRADPIKCFTQVIRNDQIQFGVAVRQSGRADFYWNYTLVNTSAPEERFDDCTSNFESLFLKQTWSNQIFEFGLKHEGRLGMDIAVNYLYEQPYWIGRMYGLIKDHCRLFTSYTLSNIYFIVSYLNFVSVYDVITKHFIKHFEFNSRCMKLFRTERSDYGSGVNLDSSQALICVHLENNEIAIIEVAKDEESGDDTYTVRQQRENLPGRIKTIVSDTRDYASHFILTEIDHHKKVYGLKQDKASDISAAIKMNDDSQLVKFISQDKEEDFAILDQKKNTLTSFLNSPNYDSSFLISTKTVFEIKNLKDYIPENLPSSLHSALTCTNPDILILVDQVNIYKYSISSKQITSVFRDQNIANLQVIDEKYIYALMNKSSTRPAGFYFMNAESLISGSDEANTFKMKRALVGQMTSLSYYRSDERIGYMTDYESVKIVPVLHRNTIAFFGIKRKSNYVCFRKHADKLNCLDFDNIITTFSIATGKILKRVKLKKPVISSSHKIWACDSSDVTYKNSYYYPRVLIYDTTPVEMDEEKFYEERLKCDLDNCTPYTSMLSKVFHKFTVLEILNENEVKVCFSFVHPIISTEPYQRIYISDDLEYVLERLQNQRVFLYRKVQMGDGLCKLVIIRRIKQFPKDISDFSGNCYLFSPNLQYYLDYDQNDGCFNILRTVDQTVYRTIPKGLLNSDHWHLIARKFMWIDNTKIRIVNIEGIEKVLDFHNNLEQISYGTVPMLKHEDYVYENGQYHNPAFSDEHDVKEIVKIKEMAESNQQGHYFFDTMRVDISNIETKLRLKYQKYFRAFYVDNKQNPEQLYDALFQVDFDSQKPMADLSFSYFHWKLAELLSDSKRKIKLKHLNTNDIKLLLLNIFPLGNTVLHLAIKNLSAIKRFYSTIRDSNQSGYRFEIPFVANFELETPIHLCLKTKNYKAADIIIQNLIDTPLDSHARGILDILPELIEADIPSLKTYLDGRFIQTDQIKAIRRGSIKFASENSEYAVESCELWPNRLTVEEKLFTKSQLDSEIKLEFLDLPSIHSYVGKTGQAFFVALAGSQNMDIFACRSVQAIIDYKWPLVREYTIKLLFIPFLFFHATWIIYSNVYNGQLEKSENDVKISDKVLIGLLYAFSIYFLFNESRQFINQGFEYLLSAWNYVDILPPIFIITVISLNLVVYVRNQGKIFVSEEDTVEGGGESTEKTSDDFYSPNNFKQTIHALSSLLMWAKLLYFLRIFYTTGYLIRMLTTVIWDMKIFLTILFLIYFAFGEAFLRLSEASDPEVAFITNYAMAWVYAYRLSIGDGDTSTFFDTIQPTTLWILWCLCLLLTNIVMLNMLIAIIGQSFEEVTSMQKPASYKERAAIISENAFLIPIYRKREMNDWNSYIITAMEVTEQEEVDPSANLVDQFSAIEEQFTSLKNEQQDKQRVLEEKIERVLAKAKK